MPAPLDPDFLIQAHRGAGAAQPENTLEACEYTWEASSRLIPECDVNTTLDGVLVAFHDNELSRVAKDLDASLAGKRIREITWEQARGLDVGAGMGAEFSGRYLPCLIDIFAKLRVQPRRRLYLDHKRAALPVLAELVRQCEVERRVILCSPVLDLAGTWKNLVPDSKTLLWIWNSGHESIAQGVEEARKVGFTGIDAIQLHAQCLPEGGFIPSSEFIRDLVRELKALRKVVQVYPFEGSFGKRCSMEAVHGLLDLGVESFAMDFPEDVLRAVEEH